MTKRASLDASSVSGVNGKSDGKSPTPSSMTGTEPPNPAPCQPFPQRCESQEWRLSSSSQRTSSSVSPSRTLERPGSRPHPPYSPPQDRNRLTSPLSHSVISSSLLSPCATKACDSGEERGGFASSSMHLLPKLRIFPALALPLSQWSSTHPCQPWLLVLSLQPDPPHCPTIRSRPTKSFHKCTFTAPALLKLGPEAKSFFPGRSGSILF